MKLSHSELEAFRTNPHAFVDRGDGRFPRIGMFRYWQFALRTYHKKGRQAALARLDGDLTGHFKATKPNLRKFAELKRQLVAYAMSFEALGHVAVEVQTRLNANPCPNLQIGGEIARLDLVPTGGYAVFLFWKEGGQGWQTQIRFPVVQQYFSSKLGAPLKEITVGVYCVQTTTHQVSRFSASAVARAQTELANAMAQIS
jgi:hypothetical protein